MEWGTVMATSGKRVRWMVGASAVAVTVVIGLGTGAFGSGVSAAATKQARSSAVTVHKVVPEVVPATGPKKEVLEATYIESGTSGVSLPASTPVAIDALHAITCPAPAGATCTITNTVSIQEGLGPNYADNNMAAPWQLDGAYVGEGGPFFSSAPADGSYAGGTWTDADYGVTAGKHHVQTFAYSVDGATLANWTITYKVYEP